jgi:hypothetical protein
MTFADALGPDRFGLVADDVGAYVAQKIVRLAPRAGDRPLCFHDPYRGIGRRWVDPDNVEEIWYPC